MISRGGVALSAASSYRESTRDISRIVDAGLQVFKEYCDPFSVIFSKSEHFKCAVYHLEANTIKCFFEIDKEDVSWEIFILGMLEYVKSCSCDFTYEPLWHIPFLFGPDEFIQHSFQPVCLDSLDYFIKGV